MSCLSGWYILDSFQNLTFASLSVAEKVKPRQWSESRRLRPTPSSLKGRLLAWGDGGEWLLLDCLLGYWGGGLFCWGLGGVLGGELGGGVDAEVVSFVIFC